MAQAVRIILTGTQVMCLEFRLFRC